MRSHLFLIAAATLAAADPSPARAQPVPYEGYFQAPQAPPPSGVAAVSPQPAPIQPGVTWSPPRETLPSAGDDEVRFDDIDEENFYDQQVEQQARLEAEQQPDPSYVDDGYDREAYTDYQAALAPYGEWDSDPDYGEVWTPSESVVGADFSPYATGGHWVLTEYGWTWVSDWGWGWAPFHYGRWAMIGSRGWSWIPGRVWGPAWVSWRYGGGFVGWSPLGPRGRVFVPPPPRAGSTPWRFTTAAGMLDAHPRFVTQAHASAAFHMTAPLHNVQAVNGFRVEAGPHPQLVASTVGRAITPAAVHQLDAAAPRATIVPRATSNHPALMQPYGSPERPPLASAPGNRAPQATYHAPAAAYGAPGFPTYHAQAYSPGYRAPAYGAPAYRPQVYSPPAYRSPSYPAYQGSAYSPAYRAPSYSAPAYRAPSYQAPSYSAPSYHAPSYSAPSYHAPSYSAPSYQPSTSSSHPSYSAPHFGGGGGGGGRHR